MRFDYRLFLIKSNLKFSFFLSRKSLSLLGIQKKTFFMEEIYKKILPEDIFITIFDREPTEEELWTGISRKYPGHKDSGNDFIDLFAGLIRRYGRKSTPFYAKRMGMKRMELNMAIHAMAGISSNEWINRYLMLAAKDLLAHSDFEISEIAKRLGFSQLSVFTKMFIERCKMPPREYRWMKRGRKG